MCFAVSYLTALNTHLPPSSPPILPRNVAWQARTQALRTIGAEAAEAAARAARGPVVWRSFPQQALAFEFAASCVEAGVRVYACEAPGLGGGGRRRYLVSNARFFERYFRLPRAERCHYEIIPEGAPCRLYFDLEFVRGTNEHRDGVAMTRALGDYACAALARHYGVRCGWSDVVCLDSTTANKFSRHLIVAAPGAVFRSYADVGAFVRRIVGELGAVAGEDVDPNDVDAKDGTTPSSTEDAWIAAAEAVEAADAAAMQVQTAESLENALLEAAVERAEGIEVIEKANVMAATETMEGSETIVDSINAAEPTKATASTVEAVEVVGASEAAEAAEEIEMIEALETAEASDIAGCSTNDLLETAEAPEVLAGTAHDPFDPAAAGDMAEGNANDLLGTAQAAEVLEARAAVKDMEAMECNMTDGSTARTARTAEATPTDKLSTTKLSTINLKRELAKELSGETRPRSVTTGATVAEATQTGLASDALRTAPLSPTRHAPASIDGNRLSGNKRKIAASLPPSAPNPELPPLAASLPSSASNPGLPAVDNVLARRAAAALRVRNALGQRACFIDLGVYTRNRNFRLYLSSKLGRQAWLRVAPDCELPITGDTAEARARCVFDKATVAQVAYSESASWLLRCTDPAEKNKSRAQVASVAGRQSGYAAGEAVHGTERGGLFAV